MKVYYIYHSCFVIEDESYIFVFDYYKIPHLKDRKFDLTEIFDRYENRGKTIVVCVSHAHSDHYTPEIFAWDNGKRDIVYVVSDDVKVAKKVAKKSNYCLISPGKSVLVDDNLEINAFDSTDEGVSFLLSYGGKVLFHAGDLNWWHWAEDTDANNQAMEDNFKLFVDNIREKLDEECKEIDIAMVPVDPRLEQYTYEGAKWYNNVLKPKIIAPMHFWGEFGVTEKLHETMPHARVISDNIQEIVEI